MALRLSTTSTGMRRVMLVTGRSRTMRCFSFSLSIQGLLVRLGGACGNDADAFVCFERDVHHEQQSAGLIESDHRIACFVVARCIGQHEDGSMKTVAASSKRMPCLRRFA